MNEENDFLRDFSLVPDWARQPAAQGVQINVSERARHEPRGRERGRHPGADRRRPAQGSVDFKPGAGRPRPTRESFSRDRFHQAETSAAAYQISFIPERRGLKPLVIQLSRTKRAWPLVDVARMFLSKPEFYACKIEAPAPREPAAPPADLFQCTECQHPFQTRAVAINHTMARHFEAFFAREEQQAEPPKGDFAVVARCGLSGVLLGPPNYHLYNEKIAELHRTRFADMPMEVYRRHIVNEADPDLIEKWRQEASLQVAFRSLREPQELVFNRAAEAEAHFMNHYAPTLVREGRRVIIPGTLARELEDHGLMQRIRQAWMRESRSPVRLTLAVRPAFRQLGLHMFRDPDKTVFVTSIVPKTLTPVQAAPAVTFILDYLARHPHAAPDDLAQGWTGAGDNDLAELKRQLHWLVDKGHVVEYYNATLSVPPGAGRRPLENEVPAACPADGADDPATDVAPS